MSLEVADRPAAEKTVQLKLAASEQQDVSLQWTRQAGCLDRMIPGLGINVIEDRE